VLFPDDIHAKLDAFIADEHGRTGDKLAHLMLALSAEGAVEGIARFAAARLAHDDSVVGRKLWPQLFMLAIRIDDNN
jgi:hypothetical protein